MAPVQTQKVRSGGNGTLLDRRHLVAEGSLVGQGEGRGLPEPVLPSPPALNFPIVLAMRL